MSPILTKTMKKMNKDFSDLKQKEKFHMFSNEFLETASDRELEFFFSFENIKF